MNKQNQELQDLIDLIERDEFMSDKVKVLGRSTLYGNSLALYRYKDLLDVINFSKIADTLHLITHYGAVSKKKMKDAENGNDLKKLADLTIRRPYTEKYLKQYSLREIDCSLDKMFPNPIGLLDEDRWYTVAARILLNTFMGIELEINHRASRLYFRDEDGTRQYIDHFSESSFAEFLEIVLHTSELFDYQLDWSEKNLKRFLANLRENERFITHETDV